MFTPREYQSEGHGNTMDYLKSKAGVKPGLVVHPTGTGKSLSIAMVADEYDEKIVVICPSQEILSQNYKKYLSFGASASIYSASFKQKEMGDVTFATLASIKSLGKEFKNHGVSLLIMDEAHLNSNPTGGMFKTFIGDLAPKHTLGYTATPFRLKAYKDPSGYSYSQLTLMNRSRPKFFSNIVHVTQIPYCVEKGYWAPVEVQIHDFNPLGLVLNSTGAEFTETSIESTLIKNNVNNNIYKLIKSQLKDGFQSVLVFLDKVENCYKMTSALGPLAAVVEAGTKTKDRIAILEKFKSGEIKVVCCVSTLTTGFDFPELESVIMGRPTNSLAVFYQIYGRLVRPFEDKIGFFHDFGGNITRFGKMEDMTFEDYNDHGWAFFSGDNLLTGTPMGEEPTTKAELDRMEKIAWKPGTSELFSFGAWKDKPIEDIPITYIKWALENARSNMTLPLINKCKQRMTTV